jgi:putative transcriptional regulator
VLHEDKHSAAFRQEEPATGKILIAEPFLKDPNFTRSVILLCQHQEAGSFGFIINKLFSQTLDDLIPETHAEDTPVYFGGPVQLDTVHFIHRVPELIEGGLPVVPGVYWGGDFERAVELLRLGLIHQTQIKFFIGYSGWEEGQLAHELKEHSWIVSSVNQALLFDEEESKVWTTSLRSMGSEFAAMANYPVDPSLN